MQALSLATVAMAFFFGNTGNSGRQQDGPPNPNQLRAEAHALMDKAASLKAQGSGADAQELMQRAKELMAAADKAAAPYKEHRASEEHRFHEAELQLDRLRGRLKELTAAGRRDEADKVGRDMHELEGRLANARAARHPPESDDRFAELKRRIADLREAGRLEEAEALTREAHAMMERRSAEAGEERIRHLITAVEHLHAAGLHEEAERLGHRVEEMKHGPASEHPPSEQHVGELQEQIRQLRGQVEELGQAVRRLAAQVEESKRGG